MAVSFKNNPITNYFRTSWQELSRVVWPSREQAIKHTLMVVAGCIVIAIFFGAVDFILSSALQVFVTKL
jgi:preprotein translocase SecE subunit